MVNIRCMSEKVIYFVALTVFGVAGLKALCIIYVWHIVIVMGHRKQQSFNRRLENSFFFQVYLISVQPKTFASPHRYFTSSWAAVVTLASGQRTSVISSYQNNASPQPRTAASHWGFVSVSSAIKYAKSQRVFWLSQDIVHTFNI